MMNAKIAGKVILASLLLNLGLKNQCYAFIGGPPISTFSAALLIENFGLFVLSFSLSVVFQGWFVHLRHNEIKFLDSTLKALSMKALFLLYAPFLLLLCDIIAMSFFAFVVDNIEGLKWFSDSPWLVGVIYFIIGLVLITFIVGKIENFFFTNKWPRIQRKNLIRTLSISNIVIFTVALVLIVINKEYLLT